MAVSTGLELDVAGFGWMWLVLPFSNTFRVQCCVFVLDGFSYYQ